MSGIAFAGDAESSYLTDQFLAFQAELVRVKRALCAASAAAPDSDSAPAPQPDPAPQPQSDAAAYAPAAALAPPQVGHGLRGFLELQDVQAAGFGGRYAQENHDEARYLKAALADEALIRLQGWPHSGQWINHLLEHALFGSRRAGDRVFDAIDALLRERVPARREMGMLYLYALAMGFEGRYRGGADAAAQLQRRRMDLYRYAAGQLPDRVFSDAAAQDGAADGADQQHDLGRRMLPQPYQYTLAAGAAQMLPNPRRWSGVFAALALLLLALSWFIWHRHTDALARHLDGSAAGQFKASADACEMAMQKVSCAPPIVTP